MRIGPIRAVILATLRASIGLIYHLMLSHKTYKNQGICYVTKTFVARNKFPYVKVARNTKKVGQACHRPYSILLIYEQFPFESNPTG